MCKKTVFLIACMFFLVGCTDQKILERMSLTTLIGYDLGDEDKLTTTAVIRQINPDLESKIELQSATAATSKGARAKIDLKTSKRIGSGQLRVVLFGEELAEAGLDDSLHMLLMNPEVSNATYLAMVEGDLKSMLEYKYENNTDLGQHIYQLIKHNIEQQNVISSTLHEVNRDRLSYIANYAMPILKKEGDNIEISGISFFNNGQAIGNLPSEDAIYFLMIKGNTRNGTLELVLPSTTLENSPKELQIAIDSIQSKRSIELVNPTVPEFNLTIKLECRLSEYDSNVSIAAASIFQKLEKAINRKIESEINQIIQYSHDIDTDIFHFGEYYKAQNRNADIDKGKWKEMYRGIKINVTVNTKILRDGVIQ